MGMGEWKEYKLGELGTVVTGKTPSSKNPEDWGDDMFFVTPTDYRNYRKYVDGSERKLSDIGVKRLANKVLPPYSVLVTCIGSDMGKVVITKDPCITNQQINSIIPNESVDPHFLYYTLINSYDVLRVMGGDGTAVPIVNKRDFENIKIEIPSLEEQKRIAFILSSLDDKIDLLYRENKTLEAMAETLFNKTLSEKENNGTIEQLISIQNGYAFKSKDFQERGVNGVIKIKNISGGVIDINKTDCVGNDIIQGISSKFKVHTGDILIAMTGAEIGKLGIIPSTNKDLWLNQRVGMLVERYPGAKYIAYLQLRSDYGLDYVENTATGSAQPNISSSAIENCGFPLLDVSEIKALAYQLEGLYEKIIHNLGHINGLKLLRNELLLKLMNSQV